MQKSRMKAMPTAFSDAKGTIHQNLCPKTHCKRYVL
jgi:hypothetical protein